MQWNFLAIKGMSYQVTQRQGGILHAYCQLKEASLEILRAI